MCSFYGGVEVLIKLHASNFLFALHFSCLLGLILQAKKVITRVDWEKKLNNVKVRKEDMNKLVMNFLVTEGYVEAAEKFRLESGTERILFNFPFPFFIYLHILYDLCVVSFTYGFPY